MAPKYKLMYFNGRGAAEPIRLIFAYTKVDYEDCRFERDEWPKVKETMPWGQLPVLEVDGVKLAQSKAIVRYLAKTHGGAGETDWEQAKCDEYVDALGDMNQEIIKWYFESDEGKKAELLKKLDEDVIPKYLSKFELIVKENENGLLVGKKLTFADLFLSHAVSVMQALGSKINLSKFPDVVKHTEMVNAQPGIKEWIERRPKTAF